MKSAVKYVGSIDICSGSFSKENNVVNPRIKMFGKLNVFCDFFTVINILERPFLIIVKKYFGTNLFKNQTLLSFLGREFLCFARF